MIENLNRREFKINKKSSSKVDEERIRDLTSKLRRASTALIEELGDSFTGLMLFGSWARLEAREDSDVDVLVIVRGPRSMELRSKIYAVISSFVKKPLTLIDVSLEDLMRKDLELTPLLLNSLYDGIIIYDPYKTLSKLKKKTFKLIEIADLVRYRTHDGKYGWMRRNGKPLKPVKI